MEKPALYLEMEEKLSKLIDAHDDKKAAGMKKGCCGGETCGYHHPLEDYSIPLGFEHKAIAWMFDELTRIVGEQRSEIAALKTVPEPLAGNALYQAVVDEIDRKLSVGDYPHHWDDGFCRERMVAGVLCRVIEARDARIQQLAEDMVQLQATVAQLVADPDKKQLPVAQINVVECNVEGEQHGLVV